MLQNMYSQSVTTRDIRVSSKVSGAIISDISAPLSCYAPCIISAHNFLLLYFCIYHSSYSLACSIKLNEELPRMLRLSLIGYHTNTNTFNICTYTILLGRKTTIFCGVQASYTY